MVKQQKITRETQEQTDDDTDGRMPSGDAAIADLQERLQAKEKEATDHYDKYVRALAELENAKKRAVRDKADCLKYGNESILRDVLPLIDGIDRALDHASASENIAAFKEGLKMLQQQVLCCLEKHGVQRIEAAGKDFDPNLHDAMMLVAGASQDDNKVMNELEKGYLLHGRLLRPAKVSVCKCATKSPAEEADGDNGDRGEQKEDTDNG